MNLERKKLNIDFPIDYKLIDRGGDKLAIVLHGFGQCALTIESELSSSIPEQYNLLIPNGPFPIPKIRADRIEERFAWYFYNRHTDSYKINYDLPSKLLSGLIEELGYKETEKIIVGYSQGGYLSPFLSNELSNVTTIFALACTLKWQFLSNDFNQKIVQIHGTEDLMVDYNNSVEHFKEFKKLSPTSLYFSLDGEGHRLTNSFREKLTELVNNQ